MPENTEKIGILVFAKDSASKVLTGIGTSAKVATKGVEGLSKAGGNAFKGIGIASALMNQSLELGKKAIEMFNKSITETIKHAFAFRKANDPALKQFQELGKSANVLRARLGDALIPIFQGLSKTLQPIIDSMSKWVVINRKLIGSTLITWLTNAANLLTEGVAWGTLQVARAWNGWLMIINTIQLAVNSFFDIFLSGLDKILGGMSTLLSKAGFEGLSSALDKAQGSVKGLKNEFAKTASQNKQDLQGNISSLDNMEKKINSIKATVLTAIGEASTNAFKALETSIVGANEKIVEQKNELEKLEEKSSDWFERFLARKEKERAMIEMQTQLILDLQAKHEAELQAMADNVSGFVNDLSSTITGGVVDAMWAAAEGTQSFGKTMELVMKGIGKSIMKAALDVLTQRLVGMAINALFNVKEVMGSAAVASANAFAATAAIPIVGPELAPAAAAAAYAQVAAMSAAVPMQFGGKVVGGLPGADSIPALLAPKERVLNEREAGEWERTKAGEGGGGGNVININTTLEVQPGTDEEIARLWIDQWDRVMTDLVKDNRLAFVRAI